MQKTSEPQSNKSCQCDAPNLSRRNFLFVAGATPFAMAGCTSSVFSNLSYGKDYHEAIKAHDSLRAYWRFDDNVIDELSGLPAKTKQVNSFENGAVTGSGIQLSPGNSLEVDDTKHLYGRFATIELFFKVNSQPRGDDNPVIIAQANGENVRYIIGVENDLSALLYRNVNGKVVTRIDLPTGKGIEVGRWYHLAVTSFDVDLRAYVDGFECSLFGGAYEFTRRGPKTSVMTFGSTTASGWSSADISLDEVATYEEGLTPSDFQRHLLAAGWDTKLAETGALVAAVKAKRDQVRQQKTEKIRLDSVLTAPGTTQVYENEYLEAINFTVGGIGSGAIQFDGKARPKIWQIACNFPEIEVEDTFLAIRAQSPGAVPITKALQTEAAGAFKPMQALKFEGEYPFAKYNFEDKELPVDVSLNVFNPFTPMDLKNSSIPCAIYQVTVTNNNAHSVTVDILSSQKNALGYANDKNGKYGTNQNKLVTKNGATMLHMTRANNNKADMVLMTLSDGATGTAQWKSNEALKREFTEKGAITGPITSGPSSEGKSVNGALIAPLKLAPGETQTVSFVLTWSFSETLHGTIFTAPKGKPWSRTGQMYNNWWSDALDVAAYVQTNFADLTRRTRQFHDSLYASTLPVWLIDRCSSQLAVLRSQTCWWSKDGYFGAWEGCNPNSGCCQANCTHVWHYAQSHARLLPELGRIMREQDYDMQFEDGLLPYRHNNTKPAADGHFGTILNTYREHLCSKDNKWLKEQWPRVKKAIEWGIKEWDPERIGYTKNEQHNTLDGQLDGCSSWIGSLYLTSLEASARMAEIVGETALAVEYRRIRTMGKQLQNDRLWNGEYYIQESENKPIQNYLDGCHIDQILGEWWADQINIDRNYPKSRSKKAMQSLLKYNFRADFYGQSLKPRQYCEIDDGGMKMITWPNGPQPIPGMKYGDEVMTGFEYGAAVSMIQNDMLIDGLMLLKVVADRYDGRLRTEGVSDVKNGPWGYSGNPYGDDECGKYYGRSLSVWSALTALQGFKYDGPAAVIGFNPVFTPEAHVSFFTAALGYGLFKQTISSNTINCAMSLQEGEMNVKEINLGSKNAIKRVEVQLNSKQIAASYVYKNDELIINLAKEITLQEKDEITINASMA
ncbi:GH116 family glycosyl-hydrolase [Psychrosphaera sp. 1_MG-2023]|uniref:GH116 family glycosyl-hydrolase n=1 Tax=Psychrosphaera sp. 1_MG-2023 TaxID=3062643 RepID=UPI0026E3D238|nr:GH116 family glycosyl-hydrolase [Psychrosphaera sp. 1_MG-2023]MDO6719788.1 GH116 family glycosyl-hydrolase [Psychrosphaera sp. 1_MG-2023]